LVAALDVTAGTDVAGAGAVLVVGSAKPAPVTRPT